MASVRCGRSAALSRRRMTPYAALVPLRGPRAAPSIALGAVQSGYQLLQSSGQIVFPVTQLFAISAAFPKPGLRRLNSLGKQFSP